MVSALQSGCSSHSFQNRAEESVPRAFRLPNRAQNIARAAFSDTAVGMRGAGRRSEILARISSAKPKIFSEHPISRCRMVRVLLLLAFLEAFPFEFGDLFDESLHFVIIAHRLTDAVFPLLGDRKLAQLPLAALDQVEGSVEFAASAMAIGFAAGPTTNREGSAQEPGVMDELSQPGSEVAFGGGEAGPMHRVTSYLR
jgi:hypothetical protein